MVITQPALLPAVVASGAAQRLLVCTETDLGAAPDPATTADVATVPSIRNKPATVSALFDDRSNVPPATTTFVAAKPCSRPSCNVPAMTYVFPVPLFAAAVMVAYLTGQTGGAALWRATAAKTGELRRRLAPPQPSRPAPIRPPTAPADTPQGKQA